MRLFLVVILIAFGWVFYENAVGADAIPIHAVAAYLVLAISVAMGLQLAQRD
jgi:hypothetical protein